MSHSAHPCEGRETYSPLSIVYENVVIAAQLGFGAALLRSYRVFGVPAPSLAFLLFCAVMLGYVLRRQLCSRCAYYDRWCHCGWGKLAALVVARSSEPPTTSKLAPVFWMTVTLLPPVAVGVALALSQTTWRQELPILGGFVVAAALGMEMHLRDCKGCKMRRSCSGSAART